MLALIATACTAEPTTTRTPAARSETHLVDGYPIDRSLNGLVSWRDLDTVVIVDNVEFGTAVALPSRPGFPAVVTLAHARVRHGLMGRHTSGSQVATVFAGGDAEGMSVRASRELAPSRSALATKGTFLLAGETRSTPELGTVLDPLFVYRVESSGRVVSLLDSGGANARPTFTVAELTQALNARAGHTR